MSLPNLKIEKATTYRIPPEVHSRLEDFATAMPGGASANSIAVAFLKEMIALVWNP